MSALQTYSIDVTGVLHISNDGGQSYTTSNAFQGAFGAVSNVHARLHVHKYNHQKVFGAYTNPADLQDSKIVRSYDGGVTAVVVPGNWNDVAINDNFSNTTGPDRQSCAFASVSGDVDDSDSVIVMTGLTHLYHSIDGGFNWDYVGSINNILGFTPSEVYRDIFFANSNVGIWCLGNKLFRTMDGQYGNGQWTEINPPVVTGMQSAVIDETGLIIVVCDKDNIHRTVNGGASWTTVWIGSNDFREFSPCHDDPDVLYMDTFGASTTRFRSIDFGATWEGLSSSIACVERHFHDNCFGPGMASMDFGFLRTENGGATYTIIDTSAQKLWHTVAASYDCGCPPDSYYDEANNECVTGEKCCETDTCTEPGTSCFRSNPVDCCFTLTPCTPNGGPVNTTATLTPDIADYVGQTVMLEGSTSCYTVTAGDAACDDGVAVTIVAFYNDCSECKPVYQLNVCSDHDYPDIVQTGPIYTNSEIFAGHIGDIVSFTGNDLYAACYRVGIANFDDTPLVDFEESDVDEWLTDCESCGYYKLTSCTDAENILYSKDPTLQPYVGQTGGLTDAELLPQIQAYMYGVGAAASINKALYRTVDGGANWVQLTDFTDTIPDDTYAYGSIGVNRFDPDIVVFAATSSTTPFPSTIVTSIEGGTAPFLASGNYGNIFDDLTGGSATSSTTTARIATVNAVTMMMIGKSYLYRGEYPAGEWNYIGDLNTLLSTTVNTSEVRDIHFANSTRGVLSIGAAVYVTSNGGNAWTATPSVPVAANIKSVVIDATGQIINLLEDTSIWRTVDGGTTWTEIVSTVPSDAIRFTPCLDNTNTLTLEYSHLGGTTTIYRSTDFGATWVTTTASQTFQAFFFNNDCISTGVGQYLGSLLETSDGGVTVSTDPTVTERYWHAGAGSYTFDQCYDVEFINGVTTEPLIDNPFSQNPYQDCECCLYQEPEPEFVKYTRVIPEPVREFYRLVQSRCVVDTYVKFGKAFFGEYMKEAEGITTCVDVDNDKLWMKHKLQELDKLYDETACAAAESETEEDCDEPEGFDPAFG